MTKTTITDAVAEHLVLALVETELPGTTTAVKALVAARVEFALSDLSTVDDLLAEVHKCAAGVLGR